MISSQLNTEVRGIVWSEVILTLIAGIFWQVQTIVMILIMADEFTLLSLVVLYAKPTVRSPTRPGGWPCMYTLLMSICTGIIVTFQLFATYVVALDLSYPECTTFRLVITYLIVPSWTIRDRHAILLIINIITCVLCYNLPAKKNYEFHRPEWSKLAPSTWDKIASIHCAAWLFVAGCMWPSILGAPYFCCAIGCALAWSWNVPCVSEWTFRWLMRALQLVALLHLFLLISYQQPWPQVQFQATNTLVRLLGLTRLMPIRCTDTEDTDIYPVLPVRLNPLVLLGLYYAIRSFLRHRDKEEVMLENSPGSSVTSQTPDDKLEGGGETSVEDLVLGTINNTVMMVWSVVFHSWLGFLMMIWANVMWMVPRQNHAMGISSRALSIYASLLLLITFSFSLDFDWPTHFGQLSLQQLGVLHDFQLVLTPLLIKCGFTLIFLVVLRQYTRPYFFGLRIPLSGFKDVVRVLSLMWTRYAVLAALVAMNLYDLPFYKTTSVTLTVGLLVAVLRPQYPRVPLVVYFLGVLLIAELKLTFMYIYQFDISKFISGVFGTDPRMLEQILGVRSLVSEKSALLVHLWLPTAVAMLSAIFLTVMASGMYETYSRSWSQWRANMSRFVLVPPGPDMQG